MGNMKQLRYLDLPTTSIKKLPGSICNSLDVVLREARSMPNGICKLINLQHLDISGSALTKMPEGMRDLINRRTLTLFVVGSPGRPTLTELGGAASSRGTPWPRGVA